MIAHPLRQIFRCNHAVVETGRRLAQQHEYCVLVQHVADPEAVVRMNPDTVALSGAWSCAARMASTDDAGENMTKKCEGSYRTAVTNRGEPKPATFRDFCNVWRPTIFPKLWQIPSQTRSRN